MSGNIKLYSLFHVDSEIERKHSNLDSSSGNPIDIYLNCGRLLAASCKTFGINYAIITNKAEYVKERVNLLGGGVEIVSFVTNRSVPADLSFYSAHFKLDVLRGFGEGLFGRQIGLVDLDTVVVNDFLLDSLVKSEDSLFVYDISDIERASYGDGIISQSLKAVGGPVTNIAYWFGGEFIFGNQNLFHLLSLEIDRIWPLYLKTYKELHYQGDEMVVSAALKHLENSGVSLIDVGNLIRNNGKPLIARWWSARTLGQQIPLNTAANAAILHLPADKPFLASMADYEFNPIHFIQSYRRYVRGKLFLRRIINPFLNLIFKKKYYIPVF